MTEMRLVAATTPQQPMKHPGSKIQMSATDVVLVHGAFADGSRWSKVIRRLQADGYHVTAVQLPLTSLAEDVAMTRHILGMQQGPIVLVGHSYGGMVITEAGNEPGVAGLVYVAAF